MIEQKKSEKYVADAFALQGVSARPATAARIAVALAAQMEIVAPAYSTLAFEAEPSGFLCVLEELTR